MSVQILAAVFRSPDVPSLTEFSSDSLANEFVDTVPEESAVPEVSADPEDSDDELEDVIRSSVGAVH